MAEVMRLRTITSREAETPAVVVHHKPEKATVATLQCAELINFSVKMHRCNTM